MTQRISRTHLFEAFTATCAGFDGKVDIVTACWNEIHGAYTNPLRHYHNLLHLETMYTLIRESSSDVDSLPVLTFSLFYHDIIYNPLKGDNEEKSAELAAVRLKELNVPDNLNNLAQKTILATKTHEPGKGRDTDLFLDSDLAILGFPADAYERYTRSIRKEFSAVPDLLYRPGRRKVLRHFLDMGTIFKTISFQDRFERQARLNIENELKGLS